MVKFIIPWTSQVGDDTILASDGEGIPQSGIAFNSLDRRGSQILR